MSSGWDMILSCAASASNMAYVMDHERGRFMHPTPSQPYAQAILIATGRSRGIQTESSMVAHTSILWYRCMLPPSSIFLTASTPLSISPLPTTFLDHMATIQAVVLLTAHQYLLPLLDVLRSSIHSFLHWLTCEQMFSHINPVHPRWGISTRSFSWHLPSDGSRKVRWQPRPRYSPPRKHWRSTIS